MNVCQHDWISQALMFKEKKQNGEVNIYIAFM